MTIKEKAEKVAFMHEGAVRNERGDEFLRELGAQVLMYLISDVPHSLHGLVNRILIVMTDYSKGGNGNV